MANSFARLSEIAMLRTPGRRTVVEKKKKYASLVRLS